MPEPKDPTIGDLIREVYQMRKQLSALAYVLATEEQRKYIASRWPDEANQSQVLPKSLSRR